LLRLLETYMQTQATETTSIIVPVNQRLEITEKLFGLNFPLTLEPTIFNMTERLCPEYSGGYWHFYTLSNGGFYMAPDIYSPLAVYSDSGWGEMMSTDALGVTACLYAYSHLSFSQGRLAQTCAEHFHWLRDAACAHSEARAILGAID